MRARAAYLVPSVVLFVVFSGCSSSDAALPASASSGSVIQASGEALADAGWVRGAVVDDTLAPVLGAQVAILGTELVATVDDAGLFGFDNLAPGRYDIAAQALGYESSAKSIDVVTGQETAVQFTLVKFAVTKPFLEILGPYAWYFDCRMGTPVLTGPCGGTGAIWLNDASSVEFNTSEDVVAYVGEMRWQQGSFATSKALRMSFSYVGRETTHWFCTATSESPVKWHYDMEEGCVTPEYCGIGAEQDTGGEFPEKPGTEFEGEPLVLLVYTNTPFGCATGDDPTHAAEIALQQRMESIVTLFHGEGAPDDFTAFPDS